MCALLLMCSSSNKWMRNQTTNNNNNHLRCEAGEERWDWSEGSNYFTIKISGVERIKLNRVFPTKLTQRSCRHMLESIHSQFFTFNEFFPLTTRPPQSQQIISSHRSECVHRHCRLSTCWRRHTESQKLFYDFSEWKYYDFVIKQHTNTHTWHSGQKTAEE